MGVDKYIIVCPKVWANYSANFASRVSVTFMEGMGGHSHDV
jgi:hypothetical protein